LKEKKPYFIEFMTYRMGDHSTSDNSALYRNEDERKQWKEKNDPIMRLTKFLKSQQYKDLVKESEYRNEVRNEVVESLKRCQKHPLPAIDTMFDDVYDKLPAHLLEQRE
jgi:2-oxoisovalerate dehydrogenase E1 component alpha subunit